MTTARICLENYRLSDGRDLLVPPAHGRPPYLETDPSEIIDRRTKEETLRFIHHTSGGFLRSRGIEIGGLGTVIGKIVEDAIDDSHLLAHLSSLRVHDSYTFGHSLNVCLLSVLIGLKMHLPASQLHELAVGALLHDLGKTLVPREILTKPGVLTAEEWHTIRRHGEQAFLILRSQWALPLSAAHIARQHHENYDGTGYPNRLAGDAIHLFARIVAVADNFDAFTSDRPYRRAYQSHEAYELILWSRGGKLDPAIVDIFLDTVEIFPAGSAVALGGGEIGLVVGPPPALAGRPTVKIITNGDGTSAGGDGQLIDLAGELSRTIVRVFWPGETIISAM
jgi:HD-GYP domain-containing protein (c-di-GMP phosphodiesterase class II)